MKNLASSAVCANVFVMQDASTGNGAETKPEIGKL